MSEERRPKNSLRPEPESGGDVIHGDAASCLCLDTRHGGWLQLPLQDLRAKHREATLIICMSIL